MKNRERKEGVQKDANRVGDEEGKSEVEERQEKEWMDCGVEASHICRERTDGLRGRNKFSGGGGRRGGGHDITDEACLLVKSTSFATLLWYTKGKVDSRYEYAARM